MNRWHMGTFAAVSLLAGTFLLSTALAGSDIGEFPSCAHCGMNRQAFDYSRMLVVYEDGASVGTCSLFCAEKELSGNRDRKVRAVTVAERDPFDPLPRETRSGLNDALQRLRSIQGVSARALP